MKKIKLRYDNLKFLIIDLIDHNSVPTVILDQCKNHFINNNLTYQIYHYDLEKLTVYVLTEVQ